MLPQGLLIFVRPLLATLLIAHFDHCLEYVVEPLDVLIGLVHVLKHFVEESGCNIGADLD